MTSWKKPWEIINRVRMAFICRIATVVWLAFLPLLTLAQESPKKEKPLTRILFLFDASQSMFANWQSGTRIDVAKKLFNELVDSLKRTPDVNIEVALRVYGHLKQYPPQDCDDSRLEVPFAKNNFDKIRERVNLIVPKGTTPIARSLQLCGNDFPAGPSRNIIILITDGIEECDGDPCAVSLELQKKGIYLRPFVIGIGLDENLLKKLECIGKLYNAATESSFKNLLNVVITQALNETTMQVNLLDTYKRPVETNVNMTFYDQLSGKIRYNYVHTINAAGNPDTLRIDPLSTYRIVVNTIPPVAKDSVQIVPGKHTIIAIDAPQGDLSMKFQGLSDYKKLPCIVRKTGEMNTLNVQDCNSTERYLTGTYDLEVLSLPRMRISGVEIKQSHTTTVSIPQPGIATIMSKAQGYGSVYLEENGKLTWLWNLNPNDTKEVLLLLPGDYRVIYRPRSAKESIYTIERSFKIISGSSVVVNLF